MKVILYVYIVICISSIIVYSIKINKRNNNIRDKYYLLFSFILLGFIHVYKDISSVPDIIEYIEGFKEIGQYNFQYLFSNTLVSLKAEKGFIVFNKIISLFTDSPFWLLFFTSIIILSGYYYSIRKYSPFVWLSVILYMMGPYIQSIYVLRQHMAMSILLFSYTFIIKRKIVHFCFIALLAFSIHQSAIVFIPLYFLYCIKSMRNLIIIGVVLLFLAISNLDYIVELFVQRFLTDYIYYLKGEEANWKMCALLSSVLVLRVWIMKTSFLKDGIDRLLSLILFIGVFISYLGIGLPGVSRLNMYYSTCLFLVIPNTLSHVKYIGYRNIFAVTYWIFLLIFFIKTLQTGEIRSLTINI